MSWRFQKRIRVGPFLRLNVSKGGVSTSLGTRGAHVTLGHGQVRETVGIPGSGLSWTHSTNLSHVQPPPGAAEHVCQLPDCDPAMIPAGRAIGFVLIIGLAALFALAFMLLAG